ncbi:MAG: aminodeoxychorismate synthase component I, partial [Bacteroidetes bacterium]|nr:aminodeoxychorismate synthase component I [Bacteroidota bacterium]
MKFRIDDLSDFKQKALQWSSAFDVFCCLDSNNFQDKYSKFDWLLAIGIKDELTGEAGSAFPALENFKARHTGWLMGFLTYDLKNEIENLSSGNAEHLHFPDLYFFAPQHLIVIKGCEAEILS